jgi:hypothetical protein
MLKRTNKLSVCAIEHSLDQHFSHAAGCTSDCDFHHLYLRFLFKVAERLQSTSTQ